MPPTTWRMRASRQRSSAVPDFFADECIARLVVEGLKARGFDVIDAKLVCKGDSDERVLALAASTGRIVITEDWGFGEQTVRQGQPAQGVIILSLFALAAGRREAYAVEKIAKIADNAAGYLTIIEPGRIRTRPLTAV